MYFKRKQCRYIAMFGAICLLALGAVHQSSGIAQEMSADSQSPFGGVQIPYEEVVQKVGKDSALVVKTNGKPVSATKLDWRAQLERAKDFFVNPKKFTNHRVLYLYDVSHLDSQSARRVIEYALKPEAISLFLVGDAPANSNQAPDKFYGTAFTPFTRVAASPDDFMAAAASSDLTKILTEIGHSSIELAGPKGWERFGRERQLFVAVGAPIPGIKTSELALSGTADLAANIY